MHAQHLRGGTSGGLWRSLHKGRDQYWGPCGYLRHQRQVRTFTPSPLPPPPTWALSFHPIVLYLLLCVYVFFTVPLPLLPWYNCTGWLGVKHRLTYLLFPCLSLALTLSVPGCVFCVSFSLSLLNPVTHSLSLSLAVSFRVCVSLSWSLSLTHSLCLSLSTSQSLFVCLSFSHSHHCWVKR